jgi:hypothetical protein
VVSYLRPPGFPVDVFLVGRVVGVLEDFGTVVIELLVPPMHAACRLVMISSFLPSMAPPLP